MDWKNLIKKSTSDDIIKEKLDYLDNQVKYIREQFVPKVQKMFDDIEQLVGSLSKQDRDALEEILVKKGGENDDRLRDSPSAIGYYVENDLISRLESGGMDSDSKYATPETISKLEAYAEELYSFF